MSRAGLHICTEVVIHDGRLDEFLERVSQVVDLLEANEPRTREYISYISTDGRRCQFDEYFENLDAFLEHLRGSGPKVAQLLEDVSDNFRSWIYTDVDSPEMRALIDSYGTSDLVVMGPAYAGFKRDE